MIVASLYDDTKHDDHFYNQYSAAKIDFDSLAMENQNQPITGVGVF